MRSELLSTMKDKWLIVLLLCLGMVWIVSELFLHSYHELKRIDLEHVFSAENFVGLILWLGIAVAIVIIYSVIKRRR